MPFIPTDHAEILMIMQMENDPDPYANTFGVFLDGGSVADAGSVAAVAWETNVMPVLSEDVELVGVVVRDGDGNVAELTRSEVGGVNVGSVPGNGAVLVRKLTAVAGRKNRGRFFVPGLREDEVNGAGVITPTTTNVIQGGFLDWLADMTTGLFLPVILHTLNTDPPTLITGVSTQALMATQRRRLRR